MAKTPQDWMRQTIDMAVQNVRFQHGGPFAALVIKDGELIGSGVNSVTATNDPTAHAEVLAIRAACQNVGTFQLSGCELYASCEPCPMCLGAIYWAHLSRFYYACTRHEAAAGGFDDAFLYRQLQLPLVQQAIPSEQLLCDYGAAAFVEWTESSGKILY